MATAKLKQSNVAAIREYEKVTQGDGYTHKMTKKLQGKVILDKEGQVVKEDDYSRYRAHCWEFNLYFKDGEWDVYDTLTQLDPTGAYVANIFEKVVGQMNDHLYPREHIAGPVEGDLHLPGRKIHYEIWYRDDY